MTWAVPLLVCLALLYAPLRAQAHVRLNSIRTVIIREGHELHRNRSSWVAGLDLTLYQCMSDLECREGSYCHAPSGGPAHSRCQSCRRRRRRCHRDGMCCPGNRCNNTVCVPEASAFLSQRIPDLDGAMRSQYERGWRKRQADRTAPPIKGQVGDPCLRMTDCSDGLCCARHFWTRICKPVLREGQVCTRHRRKEGRGLELFQRCHCGEGLGCRALRDAQAASSSLWATASSSKFASPNPLSRHLSPHTSVLASSSSSSSSVAKTRLHVCRRK